MAEDLGKDWENEESIDCDVADPDFLDAAFRYLYHPNEEQGVDFWWIDWQQGVESRVPGLDPLWMLNHYHYLDSERGGKRGLTFSRYAGIGSHRYPIGFSGDTIITWESLDFQPYFTANASNAGYGWWSHDIGGHMRDTGMMSFPSGGCSSACFPRSIVSTVPTARSTEKNLGIITQLPVR